MPILATDAFLAAIGDDVVIGEFIRSDVSSRAGNFIQLVDFETPDIVYLVQSTFERVAANADEVSLMFYDRLFDQYPEVKPLFAGVDMANQRAMLMQAIASTVHAMHDADKIRGPLHELGRRHIAYGVKLIHYKAVGECLIWALEKFFGSDFVPELYIAWKETYGILARMMIEGSMEVPGGSQ